MTLLGFALIFELVTVPLAIFVVREDAPAHADLLPEQRAAAAAKPASKEVQLTLSQAICTAPLQMIC